MRAAEAFARGDLREAEPQAEETWQDYEGVGEDCAVAQPHEAVGDLDAENERGSGVILCEVSKPDTEI